MVPLRGEAVWSYVMAMALNEDEAHSLGLTEKVKRYLETSSKKGA